MKGSLRVGKHFVLAGVRGQGSPCNETRSLKEWTHFPDSYDVELVKCETVASLHGKHSTKGFPDQANILDIST